MKTFQLLVATPTSVEFAGEAESLTVPGVSGEMTILPEHAPLISALRPGVLLIRAGGKDISLPTGGGVVEIGPNASTVLIR